jgi:transposase-like protein
MSKKRRKYSKEFKKDAVKDLEHHPEKTITEIAESLGVRREMLSR